MAETSTLQRTSNLRLEEELSSLLEGKDRPQNTEHVGWRNPTPHVLLDSFGSRSISYPASRRKVFLSHHHADEPSLPVSKTAEQIGSFSDLWRRIPDWWSSTEHTLIEGSNYLPAWRRSYDPNLQGGVLEVFTPLTGAGSSALANVSADAAAIAREWAGPVYDLTEWQEKTADNRGRERLAAKLQASFEVEPVEDGMGHPAEEIIGEALLRAGNDPVLDWLRDFCTDAAQPSFAASALRCLGRHDYVGTTSWRVGLVRDSLAMGSVGIRDAAVQAAESWADSDFVEVLRSHAEPEPWLRQYIFDVVGDLSG